MIQGQIKYALQAIYYLTTKFPWWKYRFHFEKKTATENRLSERIQDVRTLNFNSIANKAIEFSIRVKLNSYHRTLKWQRPDTFG